MNDYGVSQPGHIMVPGFSYINAITFGQSTTIGFTEAHDFVVGEYVSFRVTQPYGTVQLNNQRGLILSLTDDSITVNIDSLYYTPFIYPVSGYNTPPVCVPVASGVIPGTATVILDDAFDNLRTL